MENLSSQQESAQTDNSHSTFETINADQVNVTDSVIKRVTTQQIHASECGIGIVNSGTASITNSAMGALNSQEISIKDSGILMSTSQISTINDSKVGLLVGREIHGNKISSVIMIAGKIDGPVETVVDQRGLVMVGIAAGVAFGVVTALFRYLNKNR